MFRADAVTPGAAVFPDIDTERLGSELQLVEKGRARGRENQPPADASSLDSGEIAAVAAIEKLRRAGLENYEQNKRIYSERLARGEEARREVTTGSDKARGDFLATAHMAHSRLVDPARRVTDAYAHLLAFREQNKLVRPSDSPALFPLIALILFFALAEALLNSSLLGQSSEMGYLGGALLATIIALANIGFSAFLGGQIRWLNHASFLGKLRGLATLLVFVTFAATFNLVVGHLRDALTDAASLELAARDAFAAFLAMPHGVESAMSWLLALIGLVVSIFTAYKAYHSFDPYPGYAHVEVTVSDARAGYNDELEATIEALTEKRDAAIDALNEGRETVNTNLREAIDAAHGHSALKAHLRAFLDQCDLKVNVLLTAYREANRDAREEPAPAHFNTAYRFGEYVEPEFSAGRLDEAERERVAIGKIIDEAIAAIGAEYDRAIRALLKVDELEDLAQDTAEARRAREAARARDSRSASAETEGGERPARLAVISGKEEKK
ncbi:YIP1 family protein [Pararhodobacter sp. SW119]|uniref:YIP1 family protein n=1 Tax=Pararhodobacter sp. SW119 TaxID=2780075 RepID=UPI001ADFB3D9|nr:YIP1 family protein [Pararhodobacter sp. SW119]